MLSRKEILGWLKEDRAERLSTLMQKADQVRRENVGDDVHLRGLIEIGNYCIRNCHYCGLRYDNINLPRYLMTEDQILDCAEIAGKRGYGTVVIQSGEHPSIKGERLGFVIKEIKRRFNLAVAISVGERPLEDYVYWKNSGADRCLLKFETSDQQLLNRLHPPSQNRWGYDRLGFLPKLRELGYEIGSGVMIGLPGQSYISLARDIEIFRELDLDMIAVGPYISHPETPLGIEFSKSVDPSPDQVPNTALMTRKVIALARLVCPTANIPATTALASTEPEGYLRGLESGANVIMANVTPVIFRTLYDIYPNLIFRIKSDPHRQSLSAIKAAGRFIGQGRGDRIRRESLSHKRQNIWKKGAP